MLKIIINVNKHELYQPVVDVEKDLSAELTGSLLVIGKYWERCIRLTSTLKRVEGNI